MDSHLQAVYNFCKAALEEADTAAEEMRKSKPSTFRETLGNMAGYSNACYDIARLIEQLEFHEHFHQIRRDDEA